MMRTLTLFVFLGFVAAHGYESKTLSDGTTIRSRTVTTDVVRPWDVVVASDGQLWVTELDAASVSIVDPVRGTKRMLAEFGEGRAMGIALHPDLHHGTPYVFVAQVTHTINVVRFTHQNGELVDPTVIFTTQEVPDNSAARLVMLEDNTLMLGTGSFDMPETKRETSTEGKLLRFDINGQSVASNPWYDYNNPKSIASYVYSLGHRSVQGFTQVPSSHATMPGLIYEVEAGPRDGDELNLIRPGSNYGWLETDALCGADPSVTCPVVTFKGMPHDVAWYGSDAIPMWSNRMIIANGYGHALITANMRHDGSDVVNRKVNESYLDAMEIGDDDQFALSFLGYEDWVRSVNVAPDGRIYIATHQYGENSTDRIVVLENPAVHVTSVDEERTMSISCMPNPVVDRLTVRRNDEGGTAWSVTVMDALGRVVNTTPVDAFSSVASVDMQALPHGTYGISVVTPNGTVRSVVTK
jgi:glucose/arabinose dehydrogenase